MTSQSTTPQAATGRSPGDLAAAYERVRSFSSTLAEPLEVEDYVVQSMPDASPVKWHLAHTSWFFETFVLAEVDPGYRSPHPAFNYLFNSYYNTVGPQHARASRGLATRPTVREVHAYRAHVDKAMRALFDRRDIDLGPMLPIVEIGLHHEMQHQELILTDLKHAFWCNPLRPSYLDRVDDDDESETGGSLPAMAWHDFAGGLVDIGHRGEGFGYDNEFPQHRMYLEGFYLASRPVSNSEYLAFIEDGGYERAELWLDAGWRTVCAEGWRHPLYWTQRDGAWHEFTLAGEQPLNGRSAVCHLSLFEADAYARWTGARLPTEAEWEHAAQWQHTPGIFAEDRRFHPGPVSAEAGRGPAQMLGGVWEWTRSQYGPYPGYRPPEGAIGEYNGKFMCNQFVLRGGSCATPQSHIRISYRNFFPPEARWQFSGLRLAKDADA